MSKRKQALIALGVAPIAYSPLALCWYWGILPSWLCALTIAGLGGAFLLGIILDLLEPEPKIGRKGNQLKKGISMAKRRAQV